jgi:hypothetical protein
VISAHGISLDPPPGWEARIFRREGAAPVLHAASFALHERDGDFGAAATGRMAAGDRFLALVEYRPDHRLSPGQGLFEVDGRPRDLQPRDFSPRTLQVTRAGQLGCQRFFTEVGRPCCLYAVVRPGRAPLPGLVADLNRVLVTLRLQAPARGPSG